MPGASKFPAGQHYVPEMLQKHFVDRRGMLYAFDRRRPEGGIYRSIPKGVFKERHIYTVTGPDGAPSDLVEKALGRFETAADPIIERVLAHVRAGGGYDLTADERFTLLLFLLVQLKRSPDFFRGLTFDEPVRDFAEKSIAAWVDQGGEVPPGERDKLLSPEGLKVIEQAARMGALMTLSPLVLDALDARGLTIARITRPDRCFALGSLPTVRFLSPSGRRDLGDPGVELWLPIAPDIAIASSGTRHENRVVHLDHDPSIRKFNQELARQSNAIASASRELVQSLVRRLPSTPEETAAITPRP